MDSESTPINNKRKRDEDDADEYKPSKKIKENRCSICLEDLNDDIMTTSCGHTFHNNCINEWKNHASTCPICRKVIFEPIIREPEILFIERNRNNMNILINWNNTFYLISYTF